MKIFCPVWGEKHLDLLSKALLKSLSWPSNKFEVDDAEWHIVTAEEKEFQEAKKRITRVFPRARFNSGIFPELKAKEEPIEATLLIALEHAIEDCLAWHQPMLMATPDYIFGDGTIECFRTLGIDDACVSMAHMRTLPAILESIPDSPPTNPKLLRLAMKNSHCTWTGSERELHDGCTVFGGIQWMKQSDEITLVRHWLPAPFYVNFTQDDLDFFKNFKAGHYNGHLYLRTFALWDHLWASRLIDQGRLRIIGSSDAAMMVEVTDEKANHPRPNYPHQTNRQGYILNQPHNHIQKQFVTIFRREK